uniref:Sucrose-phosphate phosphatase n=1 Tax=Opuntia streptacantha TaxID=393608 RepID=A0A7C8YP62_OPUST
MKKFEADGKMPFNTLVCGDSGNDAELFTIQGVYGVMVSNAQEELLAWHAQHAKNNQKIVHASERCASGIIQAIGHFGLGPSVTPRDDLTFSNHMKKQMHPALEVVKLYLYCERWLRGDVENCEQVMQTLKSNFHQSGIVVHPSGVEKHLHECVDVLDKSYGCKQDCRIWVDQISSAQIGSDIWLVKFHKWELSGDVLQLCCLCCCKYLISELILELLHSSIAPMIPNIFFKKLILNVYCPDKCYAGMYQGGERHCCLTTVLLNAEAEGFTWMHIHQTWLNTTSVDPPSTWLF